MRPGNWRWLGGLWRNRLPKSGLKFKRQCASLGVESLEDRTMLSISPSSADAHNVSFLGTSSDNLWLKTTTGGLLAYSDDGASYSTDMGGGQQIALGSGGTTTITLGDMSTLHIAGLSGAGSDVVFQTVAAANGAYGSLAEPQDVSVEGNIYTKGGNFSILNAEGIDVSPGVVISTLQTGAGGVSVGNSGSITLTSENPDPLNPIFNVNFVGPHVTLGPGVDLLADANNQNGTTYSDGNVTLSAQNLSYSINGVGCNVLAAVSRNASLTISNGDLLQGNEVSATVNAGDITITQLVAEADPSNTWGPWVAGVVQDVIAQASGGLALPIAVVYKQADASLTMGSAEIDADDMATLTTNASANAPANASYSSDTNVGISGSFAYASATATTEMQSGATIHAGGNVTVGSEADPTDDSTAKTESEDGASGGQAYKFAVAVNLAYATSHTNLDAGSTITSQGSVTVSSGSGVSPTALLTNAGRSSAETGYSPNGSVGQTIAIGIKNADVKTIVDGTIISAATPTSTQPVTFNPFTDINFATSTIHIPDHGLTSGEPIVYSSGDGGSIPGLTSGVTYYVIVVDANDIQLSQSVNTVNGLPVPGPAITFTPSPTLSGNGTALAIANVDESAYTFSNNPGWTTGQAVVYHAVAGQRIGGLTDGDTYYVSVDPGDNTTFRLAMSNANAEAIASAAGSAYNQAYNADIANGDDTATAVADGEAAANTASQGTSDVVAVDQNPLFTWADSNNQPHTETFSFDPSTDSITFAKSLAQLGLTSGTALTYSGALGLSFANLTDGQIYYAVVDPSSTGATTNIFLVSSQSEATSLAGILLTAYNSASSQLANDSSLDPNYPENAVQGAALDAQDANGNPLVIDLSYDNNVMTGTTNTITPVGTGITISATDNSYDEVGGGSTNAQQPSGESGLSGGSNDSSWTSLWQTVKNSLLTTLGFDPSAPTPRPRRTRPAKRVRQRPTGPTAGPSPSTWSTTTFSPRSAGQPSCKPMPACPSLPPFSRPPPPMSRHPSRHNKKARTLPIPASPRPSPSACLPTAPRRSSRTGPRSTRATL